MVGILSYHPVSASLAKQTPHQSGSLQERSLEWQTETLYCVFFSHMRVYMCVPTCAHMHVCLQSAHDNIPVNRAVSMVWHTWLYTRISLYHLVVKDALHLLTRLPTF